MVEIANPNRPKKYVDNVLVSFTNRDVNLATSGELDFILYLIRAERIREGPGRLVEEITIHSNRLDGAMVRFSTTVVMALTNEYSEDRSG